MTSLTCKALTMSDCIFCGDKIIKPYKGKWVKKLCPECYKVYRRNFNQEECLQEAEKRHENSRILFGGYKINILYHTKQGEYRYNVVDTLTEEVFKTDDKEAFFEQLKNILIDF